MYSQSQSRSQSRNQSRSTSRSTAIRSTARSVGYRSAASSSHNGRRRTGERGQAQSRAKTRPTTTKKASLTRSSYRSRSHSGSQSTAGSRVGSQRAASPAAVVEEQPSLYTSYPPPQRQDTSTISLGTPLESSAASAVSSHTMRSASASNAPSTSRTGSSRSGGEQARQTKNHVAARSAGVQTTRSQPRTRRLVSRTARLASQVASKRQLTLAFSITFVITGIVYLALFLSRTIKGTLFHVMSIILLVSLLAVAVHSAIRWVMVKGEYKEAKEIRDRKRKTPRERGWVIGRPYEVKIGGRPVEDDGGPRSVLGDDEVPREGMRVYMREDEDIEAGLGGMMDNRAGVDDDPRLRHEGADLGDVLMGVSGEAPWSRAEGMAGPVRPAGPRPPPPVYGNFRTSVRMNPNHVYVHAAPVQPTPSTPTYDEAMSQRVNATPYNFAPAATAAGGNGEGRGPVLPGMAGYRPPSYGSEGGLTAVLETRRRGVEEAMERIHPVDRERLGRMAFRG